MSIQQIQLVVKLLKTGVRDGELLPIAAQAMQALKIGKIETAGGAERGPQSSTDVATLQAANRDTHKAGNKATHGISESIEILNARDCQVRLVYIRSTAATVSIWYEISSGIVRGIVVEFKDNPGSPRSKMRTGGADAVWDISDDRGRF